MINENINVFSNEIHICQKSRRIGCVILQLTARDHTSNLSDFFTHICICGSYLGDVANGKHDAYHGQYLDDAALLVRHQERFPPGVARFPQFCDHLWKIIREEKRRPASTNTVGSISILECNEYNKHLLICI